MTPQELLEELDRVERAQNDLYEGGPAPSATITLMAVYKNEPRGNTVRLFGNRGPTGEFLTAKDRRDGQLDVAARYKVSAVRAYILKELSHEL
jgi:hypothetical protein